MIVRKFISLLILCLLCLSGCHEQETEVQVNTNVASEEVESVPVNKSSNYYGKLHVDGTELLDENDDVVQLRGVSTHGINWFSEYINAELFAQIAGKTNANVVRVAMYTEGFSGYLTGDETNQAYLLEEIDQAVSYASDNDLYVIIDWHILEDENPLIYQDEAIEFFELMAQKYGDNEHVIFEICNEPNGNTNWEDISKYANQVIPVIREYSDNLILVGTPNYSQDVDEVIDHELDYANIMYTAHFYSATHHEELREKIKSANEAGIPIFVSEFGLSESSGEGDIDLKEANEWLQFLDDLNISYVMWSLSNKDESSAMINASEISVSGLEYNDFTDGGKWYLDYLKKEQETDAKDEDQADDEDQVDDEDQADEDEAEDDQAEDDQAEDGKQVAADEAEDENQAESNQSADGSEVTVSNETANAESTQTDSEMVTDETNNSTSSKTQASVQADTETSEDSSQVTESNDTSSSKPTPSEPEVVEPEVVEPEVVEPEVVEPEVTEPPVSSGSVSASVSLVNSWPGGYQYTITVTNNTSQTINSWALSANFNQSVSLGSGWNGNYSTSGSSVAISSMSYNGSLSPGQSASDIGFIVNCSSDPGIPSISVH